MPRPAEGESWDPHTIHTHYFGFSIPEEGRSAPSSTSGTTREFDALARRCLHLPRHPRIIIPHDMEHLDYEIGDALAQG